MLRYKLYIKDIISEVYGLERSRIKVTSGSNFDKKYKLVNLADEMAHYIFNNLTSERLSKNPHLKSFIR